MCGAQQVLELFISAKLQTLLSASLESPGLKSELLFHVSPDAIQDGQRIPHGPLRSPAYTLPDGTLYLLPSMGLYQDHSILSYSRSGSGRVVLNSLLRFLATCPQRPGALSCSEGLSSGKPIVLAVRGRGGSFILNSLAVYNRGGDGAGH